MKNEYLIRMNTFTLADLPALDEVVLGAFSYLDGISLPSLKTDVHARPLIIGSGNALETGRILFTKQDALFANEGNYKTILKDHRAIDSVYLISASGGKHSKEIAANLKNTKLPTYLITNTENSSAQTYFQKKDIFVFPKIREPYTYNTSTYASMILSTTNESPQSIVEYIEDTVSKCLPENIGTFKSYIFIVPPEYALLISMFETKFDEVFGPMVHARVFTSEEIKHAKTVISLPTQCFISLGKENTIFGQSQNRIHIPISETHDFGALLAFGYFIIGKIQRAMPPYFKMNIDAYCKEASVLFGEPIHPIVE